MSGWLSHASVAAHSRGLMIGQSQPPGVMPWYSGSLNILDRVTLGVLAGHFLLPDRLVALKLSNT